MMRLNIVKGLGPVLIVAEGWSVDLPAEVHKTLDERTDPGWPTTWFAPRLTGKGAFTDVYSVMANMGANHGAFTYGHIGADILTLASMLRIPVAMHNAAPSPMAGSRFSGFCFFSTRTASMPYRHPAAPSASTSSGIHVL